MTPQGLGNLGAQRTILALAEATAGEARTAVAVQVQYTNTARMLWQICNTVQAA